MEVRINKEIQEYQESVFLGLSLRQTVFSFLAIAIAVGLYFGFSPVLGPSRTGWICILAAFPFAVCGFFKYNGMTAEQFVLTYLRSRILCPRRLVFRAENLYAKVLENTSIKEGLRLD